MPWMRTYRGANGQIGCVFTTTMGAATDFHSEGLRRLVVNAVYWCVGLEDKIPEWANGDLVGKYDPLPFGFGGYRKAMKPSDFELR